MLQTYDNVRVYVLCESFLGHKPLKSWDMNQSFYQIPSSAEKFPPKTNEQGIFSAENIYLIYEIVHTRVTNVHRTKSTNGTIERFYAIF